MPQSENIGQINVSMGADYSPLQTAIQEAQGVAVAGGKEIANALVSGASSAGNLAQTITEQFNQVAAAAAATGQSLDTFDAQIAALVASGSTAAEAVAQVAASMTAAQAPTADEAEQLSLFSDALNAIPWAEANGQLNLFTDELEPLTAGTTQATTAAEQLATAEVEVGAAAAGSVPALNESTMTLQELAQALVAVGAAMVLVNKIEELAAAALEAADDVKRADISLTVLTGSAEVAAAEIQKLELLGQADGLSMPALLTAATRMQALLGSAAPVPALLAQLANSAAVSGQGIESAANAFDRMATSGTAAARQLVPLGINLGDLAKSFNTLSGTSMATEANIASLFKQLSETERIDVLSGALDKLNGIAGKVKNETFGGQWNALVAQWTTVLDEAGKALLPVIDDLIKITEVAIVPFLKTVIDTFNALPGPVKDVTVLLGLASVAVLGTATALGTLGIAIGGIKTLLGTLGISWASAAAGATQVAVASGEAAAAVEGAGAVAVTAGASFATLLLPLTAIAVELGILGKSIWDYVSASNAADAAQSELRSQTDALATSLQKHGADITDLQSKYKNGSISLEEYNKSLRDMVSQFSGATFSVTATGKAIDLASDSIKRISDATKTNVTDLGTAVEAYNRLNAMMGQGKATSSEVAQALAEVNAAFAKLPGSVEPVGLALANQAQKAHDASNAYQTAKGVYSTLLAAFNAGVPVYAQLAASQERLTAAEKEAAAAGAPIAGSLAGIDLAAQSVTSTIVKLASSHDVAAAKALAQGDAIRTLSQDVAIGQQKLALLAGAQADAQRAADTHRGSEDQLRTVMQAVSAAAADLQQKQDALALAIIRTRNAASEQQGAVGLAGQAVAEAALAVEQAKRQFDAGTISATAYTNAQKALVSAEQALHQTEADTAANVSRSTSAWAAADVELALSKARLEDVTTAYQNHLATMKEVVSAQKGELDARIAVDQENAIAATGTVGLTDKVSLYAQILAAAKVKLEDLKQASAAQTATAEQLLSAQESVTRATQDLDAAQTAARPKVVDVTSALDAQSEAAVADAAAVQTISQALAEVKDAFSSATVAADAFSVSAPAGYTLSSHYVGEHLYIEYVPTPATILKNDLGAAVSAADQSSNPKNQTDQLSLARQSLAEAQATLQVYSDAFKAGNALVSAQQVSSAQQAVASAQQAIAALTGGAKPGASSSAGTVLSSSGGSAYTGTLDSAAAGGTYPGVVIHQAAGELLYVALANQAAGFQPISGGSTADAANSTSALAASSTALAVSQAAGTMANVVGVMVDLTDTIGSLASTVTAAARNSTLVIGSSLQSSMPPGFTGTWSDGKRYENGVPVNGMVNGVNYVNGVPQTPQSGTYNTIGPTTNGNVGQQGNGMKPTDTEYQQAVQAAMAAAAAAGVPWDGSIPWDGIGTTPKSAVAQQPLSVPNVQGAGSGDVTFNADFSGANFSGANAEEIKTMIGTVLPDMLTRTLRDNGARY